MPRPQRATTLAVTGFVLVIAVLALGFWIPWLTARRGTVAATPAPPPLFGATAVTMTPQAPVCLANVPMDRTDQVVAFQATATPAVTAPVTVTLSARGYRERVVIPAATYAGNSPLTALINPPPGPRVATICLRPEAGSVALLASNEGRTRSRPTVTLAGKPVDASVTLTFYRRYPVSIGTELGLMARRAHVVATPLPPWLLIVLALVAILGVAPAVAWALAYSLRGPGQESGPVPPGRR